MKKRCLYFKPLATVMRVGLLLLISIILPHWLTAQCSQTDDQYEPSLLYKYWQLRHQFDQHFIKTDLDDNGNLTGDGIGTWDAANNRYTKAGYSLPVINLIMESASSSTDLFDPQDGTFLNSERTPNVQNIIGIGADNTYAMGMYIAMLASEYELLSRNGSANKTKTLNELFLALQALRRLDMTANQLSAAVCDCDVNFGLTPNTSGYTGFMVRADAPAHFHTELDDPSDSPDWRKSGTRSMFAEEVYTDGLPCNFRDEDYRNRIAGQDQIIGMLFGLAFVKQFIPDDAVVSYDGTDYTILSMAQSIAYHLVRRIESSSNRTIKYPTCPLDMLNGGPPRIPNGDGGDATAHYYGMKQLLDYILPGHGLQTSFGDYLAWQAAITLVVNGGQPIEDNERMAIELMAAGNTNFGKKARKFSRRCENINLMQIFAWASLHDKDLGDGDLDNMNEILCSLGCEGPCYTRFDENGSQTWSGPFFNCTSSTDPNNRWCTGERWKHSCGKLEDCDASYWGQKTSGYDYLLAYNLFHLNYSPYHPYFDPFEFIEKDRNEEVVDQIIGPSTICGADPQTYCLSDNPNLTFEDVEWKWSDNLSMQSSGNLTCVEFTPLNDEDAWIRVSFKDGECHYAWQKSIQMGMPQLAFDPTISAEPCLFAANIQIVGDPAPGQTYSWTVSGPYDYFYVPGSLNASYLNVTAANVAGGVVYYSAIVSNECGTQTLVGELNVPDTRCDGGGLGGMELLISPNPVDVEMQVELANALEDPFKDGNRGVFYLFDQYSTLQKTFEMSSLTQTVNVANIPNGLYFISGEIAGQPITSSQFVIQH